MEEIIIRKFKAEDREPVRDIAWETAFIGEPADAFFSGKEILADFLTFYFTDYEPDSCFVAVAGSRVVGYLIGSQDSLRLASTFKNKILAGLLGKFIFSGAIFRRKNLRAIFSFFLSFLKGEFNMAEVRISYPAVLHINLKKEFRGQGVGERLILAFEEHLRSKGVRGVHLATVSEQSSVFFRKQGFSLLYQYRRSYFRYLLGKDIRVHIYGKKL
jgi:GNAT superfamily N-acetyltransferase